MNQINDGKRYCFSVLESNCQPETGASRLCRRNRSANGCPPFVKGCPPLVTCTSPTGRFKNRNFSATFSSQFQNNRKF
ncbi:MAG: hypothetical protein LBK82_14050 [Planctomycetaceae bacterium]|nr:hypothetical protein [Planctomycetaceae bacterium]